MKENTGWQKIKKLDDLEGKDHMDDRSREGHNAGFPRRLVKPNKQE